MKSNKYDVISFSVLCSHCGEEAAQVELEPFFYTLYKTDITVFYVHGEWNFLGIGVDSFCDSRTDAETIYDEITEKGSAYLNEKDNLFNKQERIGFYCTRCMKAYCAKCWKDQERKVVAGMEATVEWITATCPAGHNSTIYDVMY